MPLASSKPFKLGLSLVEGVRDTVILQLECAAAMRQCITSVTCVPDLILVERARFQHGVDFLLQLFVFRSFCLISRGSNGIEAVITCLPQALSRCRRESGRAFPCLRDCHRAGMMSERPLTSLHSLASFCKPLRRSLMYFSDRVMLRKSTSSFASWLSCSVMLLWCMPHGSGRLQTF